MSVSEYAQKLIFSGILSLKKGRLELSETRGVIIPSPFIGYFLERIYEENGEETLEMLFQAGERMADKAIEEIAKENEMG
ncbi:MAG: hypothetical protein ABEJ72_11325, partial [Candidatus Aenigmatarchaeota archaeon]